MGAPKGNKFALGKGGGRPERTPTDRDVRPAGALAALGATDAEIAQALGIGLTPFYRWRGKYKEFQDSLRAGTNEACDRFTFESEKIVIVKGKVVRVPIMQHVPPDVTAQTRWLTNRRPHPGRARLRELSRTDGDARSGCA